MNRHGGKVPMSCLECGRSCLPCEGCGRCSDCCDCDNLAAATGCTRGVLLSLPIWAALIVWGAQIVRAFEHFSRWGWVVR